MLCIYRIYPYTLGLGFEECLTGESEKALFNLLFIMGEESCEEIKSWIFELRQPTRLFNSPDV